MWANKTAKTQMGLGLSYLPNKYQKMGTNRHAMSVP